eukprot:3141752-Alexandrium_andersonii.AAC.1
MADGVGLGPLPGLHAALGAATGAVIGGVFAADGLPPPSGAAAGELPPPAGPEVAPPLVNLTDEDLLSEALR